MTQEKLSLRKIREVLRLKHEVGLSNRAIARACCISNSTVGEYLAVPDRRNWTGRCQKNRVKKNCIRHCFRK